MLRNITAALAARAKAASLQVNGKLFVAVRDG